MSKNFTLDTSVLIYDVDSLYKFGANEVIIPSVSYEEINHLKEENSERGYYARQVAKLLDKLSKQSPLRQGVKLGDTFIRVSYDIRNQEIQKAFSADKNDYKIIACAKNNNSILISRDRMMRVIARDFVEVQEYEADMIKTDSYKGYRRIVVPEEKIEQLFTGKMENEYDLFPNEFVIMQSEWNPKHVAVGICKNKRIIHADFDKMNFKGLKLRPQNLEQKMFVYLMLDDDIKCVTATGVSGKGKSLLAVDYSLSTIENQLYNQFLYSKSVIPVDQREELGFYKGTPEEKLKPHLQPLYSSIEYLYKDELYSPTKGRKSVNQKVEEMLLDDILMFHPLANIRGMSIFDKVVMLDEAQNTNNHTMKSLVTRMVETSKLIVTGDIEQIDDKNLNEYNNGLVHLIEAGKEEEFIGHITMDMDKESKRGRLAGFGARKL